jgi:hypothetical protein
MAARFIDLAERIATERIATQRTGEKTSLPGNATLLQLLKHAKPRLKLARQTFYDSVESSWEDCATEQPLSPALVEKVSESSRGLATTARQLVDELYPCCGLAAADPRTGINRVWRNIHTASQHTLLTPKA